MSSDTSWMRQARCKNRTSEFFPPEESPGKTAKLYLDAINICSACSVRLDCLKYAIENDIIYGVWGGKSPNQRKQIIYEMSLVPRIR